MFIIFVISGDLQMLCVTSKVLKSPERTAILLLYKSPEGLCHDLVTFLMVARTPSSWLSGNSSLESFHHGLTTFLLVAEGVVMA